MIGPPDGAAQRVWVELARAHLAAGRPLVARVSGWSMWPAVRPGQRVVIAPGGTGRVGDLALVARGATLVLHRIVGRDGAGLVIKGDAVAHHDPVARPDEVLGHVPGGWSGGMVARCSRWGGRPLAEGLRRLRVALYDRS